MVMQQSIFPLTLIFAGTSSIEILRLLNALKREKATTPNPPLDFINFYVDYELDI
tara:strand:- start:219 stop:383 length:165 start_codon:yes stop_codon:yes gene_type:complete